MIVEKAISSILLISLVSLSLNVKSQPAKLNPVKENGKDTVPAVARIDSLDSATVEKEWQLYLMKNLDMTVAMENGAPGGEYTVIVQYIVGKDGNIYDVKAITKHGFGMEEEAIRVIRTFWRWTPRWTPAEQQEKPVYIYTRKQPVTFIVEGQTKKKRRKKN